MYASGTYDAKCLKKVVNGRKVEGGISGIRSLKPECVRVQHEALKVPILM